MNEISLWDVFETELTSGRDYDDPFWDAALRVSFTAPSGQQRTVDGFWDGGRTWRVRFSPDEVGAWRWESQAAPADEGLHGRAGAFRCVPYDGMNPLYKHGPVRVSADYRTLVRADYRPFFWLSDTAWNGVLRSKEEDWRHYLHTRRGQGFTVIQFVGTHWRGLSRDPQGETAFEGTDRIRLNPAFFQRLDLRVALINSHALVAAPVLLWAYAQEDPGQALSEEAALQLVRYMVARWGAYQVVWLLGGDGDYAGEKADRWKRIGRAVFETGHDRLATMHPWGQDWVADEFRFESWYSFIGYQSGHGDSEEHLRWLVEGPPAREWDKEPALPVINLEPNYETHISYHSQRRFTATEVRRAACWSLLVSPPAGVSFGHNAIWNWGEEPEVPENHEHLGVIPAWDEGVCTDGVQAMQALRWFFFSFPWWELRPAQELLAEQPGQQDPAHFVAVAQAEGLVVAYVPEGVDAIRLAPGADRPAGGRWYDPRTAVWTEAVQEGGAFAIPGEGDWLLCLGEKA